MAGASDTAAARAHELGKHYDPGEVLFREGDRGEFLFVIQRGSVRLSRQLGGRDITIAELAAGDFLGETGVVCHAETATATALTATECLLVDVPALEQMVTADAEIGLRFIRGLIERLAASHRQLDLVVGPAVARVALAIARRAESDGKRGADGVLVPRRLRDVGSEAAVGEHELGEICKTLVKQRLIRIKNNAFLVPDVQRMYEFVQMVSGTGAKAASVTP